MSGRVQSHHLEHVDVFAKVQANSGPRKLLGQKVNASSKWDAVSCGSTSFRREDREGSIS